MLIGDEELLKKYGSQLEIAKALLQGKIKPSEQEFADYLVTKRDLLQAFKLLNQKRESTIHPNPAKPQLIISCIRVERSSPTHDRVLIWNRGGFAGSLTVLAGDGDTIMDKLLELVDAKST